MKSKEIRIYNITPQGLKNVVENAINLALEKATLNSLPESTSSDELLTVEETLNYLKCSKQALWNWRKNGILPSYRMGNRVYYKKSDILSKLVKQG
ncbi:helix-turn-helix domain-containing protein [Winogradskyella schleiferi]|uniref:helix-turn-helix domain-containing protein n=1 Tax=Winogradskyella schleiferi TaxID=2686078 RepID=UPI0015B83197|nr:helix-turn-helix domain-containing protein [Winogradskyella schleiferi]